jgi:hypothetical protein
MLKVYRNFILDNFIRLLSKFNKKEYDRIFKNNTINNLYRYWFYRIFLSFIIFYKKNDFWKHWDFFKEIFLIKSSINVNDKILICSTGKDFTNIFFLSDIGYNNLYCFDIRDINNKTKKKLKKKNIKFSLQNLYDLKYEFNFKYISLTSVIEHLDQYDLMFKNLSKISETGCKLFITTDFWPDKIQTKNLYPYGKGFPEMKIFSKDDILELVDVANKNYFFLEDNEIDFEVTKKYVLWKRMNVRYTFISLTFVKK